MQLSELTPADYNPRTITDQAMEGLENTIEEFGLVQPIVWNRRTGNIVGGHQRFKVLRSQHAQEAMVCQVDISVEREKALNVALNNPYISGTFDKNLQELLLSIQADDAHLFRDIHLDWLLEEESDGKPGEDEVPEIPEVPVTQPQDVWTLGSHRLMCGDSREHADVMKLVGDRHAQCVWTDIPYGVSYRGCVEARTSREKIKGDTADDLISLLPAVFSLAFDYVSKPGSAIYVAFAAGRNSPVFYNSLLGVGYQTRQELIWVKESLVCGRSDYHFRHETIWYGDKPGDDGFGRKPGHDAVGWFGDDASDTVIQIDRPKVSKQHPTMKPVALVVATLKNSTRPLDWVYDPFGGSGTTLIAAEQLGRNCIMMEMDPAYCDVIIKRWEDQTGRKAAIQEYQTLTDGDVSSEEGQIDGN